MNKHLYRIVFNERRGQLMAVAEHASSCGKAASEASNAPGFVACGLQPVLRGVAWAALLALGSVWLAPMVSAQVIADPNASRSQQPTILQTANGLPQVNIQAPNAAGVSRNAYSQFDVQKNGVILNNSRTDVQTQQGGWVQANPWLAAGGARVILNEVNSSNPSLLNGYVEVAGQRAAVVIANPAGISVNGGGFINASQAVLTTGTPVINANGGIDSYRVSGGTVSVSGNGLDLSTTDYAAILARAVQVNAGIWANELKVVTGANQIDASTVAPNTTPVTTAIAGTGSTPAFALDVAQIGGMYAGKIFLIGTEAGLGMNNAGVIAANSGDLVLSHNGWLSNTGTLQASGNVQVNTQGNVTNTGTVYASGNNSVTTAGSVTNSGTLAAQGNTSLQAQSLNSTSAGVLGAGIQANGSLASSGDLTVTTAQTLVANGQNLAAGNLSLNAASIDISGSTTLGGNISAQATQGDLNATHASIMANNNLNFNANGVITTDQGHMQANALGFTGQSLSSQGGAIQTGTANLNFTGGNINNTGGLIQSTGAMTIQAATLDNHATNGNGQGIDANGLTLTVSQTLNNRQGLLNARGNLQVTSPGSIDNTSGTISAQGNLRITDPSTTVANNTLAVTNTQGQIISGQSLTLNAASESGDGSLSAGQNLSLTLNSDYNIAATGSLVSGGTTAVQTSGDLTNRGVIDGVNTFVQAANLTNIGTGRIYGDHLAIQTGTLTNTDETVNSVTTAATLAARARLDISASNIVNGEHALIYSGGDMAVGGALDGNQQAVGAAQSLRNGSATIDVEGNLSIAASTITNANDHFAYSIQELTDLLQTGINQNNGDPAHYYRIFDRHTYEPVVTQNDPGQITAGGNITLTGNTVTNQQSKIIAGGNLVATAGQINNTQVTDQRRINDVGTQWTWAVVSGHSDCWPCHWVDDWGMKPSAYNVNTYQTLTVSAGQTLSNSAPSSAAAQSLSTTLVRTTVTNTLNSASSPANTALTGTHGSNAGSWSLPGLPGLALPNSSLFHPTQNANANYLIETDPLFTNRNTWLGSDYMTQAITLDPTVTQKRLGDGFYEQKLIREQVADLTGKRFLGDYTSDQQEYQALMDNGITYAKQYNLRPGIALTAAQVAQLTSDIVWLEQQTVTLPDGTMTQALVPHVYLKPGSGDLTAGGALLSGANVQLNSTGDTFNSGTIAGRQIVQLNAANVSNLGQIQGASVQINAQQDIGVSQGGSITASDGLNLNAGRDINVVTGTTNSTGNDSTHSATALDRVAGLYVTGSNGTLVASAGRDLNLTAATVSSAGTAQLNAGNNVNLNAATTTSSDNFEYGDVGHTRQSTSTQTGSTVSAGGNLTINAGSDLQGTAANIKGGGNVQLTAGQDVNLLAGQNTQSSDVAWVQTSGGLVRTTTATQMTQSSAQAQTSSVSGNNVSVTAGRDLVSQGTQFKANDSLSVEGKDSQTFYAVQNTESKTYSQQSSTSLAGGVLPDLRLSKSSVDDTQAKSVSIGSSLESTNKIDVNVGNSAVFEGSTLSAKEINFNQTDASKAGQVVLTASIDTSQKSHTETNETAGVWQKQAGSGSVVQTANQTQLNGQVNMSANLQVTAQLGLQPGQTINQQVQVLSQQPGLSYLKDLQNNPKANLQSVELAKQQWDYSQQGLTSAGAAVLTIAVAVFTAGTGTAAVGTTVAAEGGAVTTMAGTTLATTTAAGVTTYTAAGAAINAGFSALAAQAGVALANNGGDIGKTLKQLGSSDSVKNTLIAMGVAGVGTAVSGQGVQAVAAQTATGCAAGALNGAGCEQGAKTAAVLSTAGETYRSVVGYAANVGPGDNRNGEGKTDQTYEPDDSGRQKIADQGMNVIGFNKPGSFFSQGGTLSRVLNEVPFINATGGLHDYVFNADLLQQTPINNIWTMPVTALIAIPASLNNSNISWLTQVKQPSPMTWVLPKSTVQSVIRVNSGVATETSGDQR